MDVPQATAVAVGLAEKDSATSTATPTPVTGAQISLSWDGEQVKLCEKNDAEGAYLSSSAVLDPLDPCTKANLAYQEGATYNVNIETGTDAYSLEFTPPPPVNAALVTFSPTLGTAPNMGVALKSHPQGVDLTVDWSQDTEAADRHAFAVLARIDYSGTDTSSINFLNPNNWQAAPQNPVFDNTPKEPGDMIKLIMNDPKTSLTIPGANYLNQPGLYVLVLTAVELSTEVSSNLALGSGALSGAGVAWIFWVD